MQYSEEVLLKRLLKAKGIKEQSRQAIEELGELIVELSKALRYQSNGGAPANLDSIAEEIADARIMIDQMELFYNTKTRSLDYRKMKLERIRIMLDTGRGL